MSVIAPTAAPSAGLEKAQLSIGSSASGSVRGSEADSGVDLEKTRKAAREFEGILIRQMLQPLEKSLMAGTGGGGNVPMVGGMVLESLSQSIVSGGGLGLAEVIETALRGRTEPTHGPEK